MKQYVLPSVLITAVLITSALAVQANAQQQTYELFSAIPEGIQAPPSLEVRSGYMVSSEMAILDTDALLSEDVLNMTLLGNTYTVSRESLDVKSPGHYSWTGSGDMVETSIFVVENGTEASGLVYATGKTFEILHVTSDIHEIYELDMSKFPPTVINDDADFVLDAHRSQEQIGDDRISELEATSVDPRCRFFTAAATCPGR